MRPSRFDYVAYDEASNTHQQLFKGEFQTVEHNINISIDSPRAKEYAMKALEECYMWIGKGIRDDQISRNGSAELQEERKDG